MEDPKKLDQNEAKKKDTDKENVVKEHSEEGKAEKKKKEDKEEKNKEGEGGGEEQEGDKKKDKKKKKDKDGGAKEKSNDPAKLRAKLEKIEAKMEALALKKVDIMHKLQEAETDPGNSATISAKEGDIKED